MDEVKKSKSIFINSQILEVESMIKDDEIMFFDENEGKNTILFDYKNSGNILIIPISTVFNSDVIITGGVSILQKITINGDLYCTFDFYIENENKLEVSGQIIFISDQTNDYSFLDSDFKYNIEE